MASEYSKLIERYVLLAAPVSADAPTGADERYSAEFDQIEQELGKEGALHEASDVDWEQVLGHCEHYLRTKSKDLRVASWLTWALHQREPFCGLVAGLSLIQQLCVLYWPQVHPLKPRTRAACINWLVPRLDSALSEHVAIADRLPLFRKLAAVLRELEGLLGQHLGPQAPLLLPLSRRLDGLIDRAGKGIATEGSVGIAIAQVKQAVTQAFSTSPAVENEKDAHKALRTLQDIGRPLCGYWLKQRVSDVRALRLTRTLVWLGIDTLPEHNAERVTSLRGVPTEKALHIRELFQEGKYADALLELETVTARAPFWLDGQRIGWECLKALNADQASREVEVQASLFIQRLPGLETLSFHDGTPFADPQTRSWISAAVMPHLRGPEQAPASLPSSETAEAAWECALREAIPIAQKSGLKLAVQHFKQAMRAATPGRERFLWQLSLARLCMDARQYELAKTQLEALCQLLEQQRLGEWEPALVLETLGLLHNCCERLPQNHAVRERKEEVHRKLCHLDLETVLD